MNLLIFTGYAESESLGALVANHDHEFATAREALADLLACLRDHLNAERAPAERKKCCKTTLKALPAARFCATCGRSTAVAEAVDYEELAEALKDLRCKENDGTGDLQEYLEARGWTLGAYLQDEPTVLVYGADYLLGEHPGIATLFEANGEEEPEREVEDGFSIRDNGERPRPGLLVLPERPRVTPADLGTSRGRV